MIWWVALLCVLAGVAALPTVLERRRHPVDARYRKGAPGKYARLSQGVTYYRWHGPARGKVVVAIHGLTTPSTVWDVIAQGLGAIGYRVLTYDLYGHGLSDAPSGPHDRAFYQQQLLDLLAHEDLTEDLTLLGYSMGGGIATAFTAAHPHRVARMILIATAGVLTSESDFSRFCRNTPYAGDWLHGLLAGRRLIAAIEADQTPSEVPGLHAAQRQEVERQGFLPAVLSARRGFLEEILEDEHRAISRDDIPVVAIWADRDPVIPISALGVLASWNRFARQDVIKGADHALPYSHASDVIHSLRQILSQRD